MILTKESFDIIRKGFGPLSQSQVDGLIFIVDGCTGLGYTYPECAYALATVYHETGGTMLPIGEKGSDKYLSKYDTGQLAKNLGNTPDADGDGQKYKGRGYVQITGLDNYKKFSTITGYDLVHEPDLALDPAIAIQIMTIGMLNGSFTGLGFRRKRPVGRYDRAAYVRARGIINGTDKAGIIANYALVFEKALRS